MLVLNRFATCRASCSCIWMGTHACILINANCKLVANLYSDVQWNVDSDLVHIFIRIPIFCIWIMDLQLYYIVHGM